MSSAFQVLSTQGLYAPARAIAFIDPGIQDYATIAAGITPNLEVMVLNPAEDGVTQILAALADHPNIAAIHIFSHGQPGKLFLGAAELNFSTIDRYTEAPGWAVLNEIDLFLYGCNVAEGAVGTAFLQKLHYLANVNIAASTTRIGNPALKGDWNLDVQIGHVEPISVLSPKVMAEYRGVLATVTVTNASDAGAGSLRQAIADAQSGDTIAFASNLAGQTITLTSGRLDIPDNKDLTVDGAAAAGLTISGNNASQIFFVNSSFVSQTSLAVKNLTLINGYTNDRGGAISSTHQGVLSVENVTFNNNVADKGGGAIFSAFEGRLTVVNSRFNNNVAIAGNDERGAGAISFWGPGPLLVQNSEFVGNRGINGAAINSLNGKMTIENSRFIGNDTTAARYDNGQPNPELRGYGGAVYADRASSSSEPSGTIRITGSTFDGNRGLAEGGAAYLFTGTQDNVIVESTVFKNNEVNPLPQGNAGNGGALVQITNGSNQGFTINNSSFVNNKSTGQGGGIWVMGAPTTITNSTFSGNSVSGTDFSNVGGGMALYSQTTIANTTIANNTAGWVGGGISAFDNVPVSVQNTIFSNNTSANGTNNWGIQQHTNRELIDNGGNFQFPPKRTNNFNDYNATASITIADPLLGNLQDAGGILIHPLQSGSPAINAGATSMAAQTALLSINNISFAENSGNALFTVNLSAASSQTVSVNYNSTDGTAFAGSDYTAASGQLTFNPGELSKTISVPIVSDALAEPNETFSVNLSNVINAGILTGQGIGTIIGDITPPTTQPPVGGGTGTPPTGGGTGTPVTGGGTPTTGGGTGTPTTGGAAPVILAGLSINDVSVQEGRRGSSSAVFAVTLATASTERISVDYETDSVTARSGSDYRRTKGTLVFEAGETFKTIAVRIKGDRKVEADEVFHVNLSNPVNTLIGDAQGVGTILNDDFRRGSVAKVINSSSSVMTTEVSSSPIVSIAEPIPVSPGGSTFKTLPDLMHQGRYITGLSTEINLAANSSSLM